VIEGAEAEATARDDTEAQVDGNEALPEQRGMLSDAPNAEDSAAEEVDQEEEEEKQEQDDIHEPGIHFRCGDVLDAPFAPEGFGVVVDKGTLDCVGMRVPPKLPLFPGWEEEEETPMEAWSGAMHLLVAPQGHLLVVTCCFDAAEVTDALAQCDSMFAEEWSFVLTAREEIQEEGTVPVRMLLFSKQPCADYASEGSASAA